MNLFIVGVIIFSQLLFIIALAKAQTYFESKDLVWLATNDTSLYKVKNSLNLINHAYDKLKLQY